MSVREDLNVTVFAMRSSFTLSWNSPSSCRLPFTSDTETSFSRLPTMHIAGDLLHPNRAFILTDFHRTGDVFHGRVGALRRDVNIAVAPGNTHVSAVRTDGYSSFAGHRNIEIGFHRVIARTIRFRVYRDQAADARDYRLGLAVVLVGIRLVLRSNSLADYHRDLVVVRGMHTDCAPSIDDLQAAPAGKSCSR